MEPGFKIAIDWKSRKAAPELPQEEILDKVSDTIVEMSIENGKMARTLHEVLILVCKKPKLAQKDVTFLRNVIIGNLGRDYANPFSKEKHKD